MKNILRNKKGFTLLEILVTVGIVGVLSAVAVPAYNQYKRGTIETAIESDIGNFQKAYMAFNAVNGTYCSSFIQAGINVRDGRNYAKNGAIGFATVNSACGTAPTVTDVRYLPTSNIPSGGCGSFTSPTTCPAARGCTWGGSPAVCSGTYQSPQAGTITACELDVDQFIIGATTNVSGIEKVWGINEEGKIKDAVASNPGTVTCPALTADWDNINTVMQ